MRGDLSLIAGAKWREAERRAEVVRPLAERPSCSRGAVCAAAAALGLSERQVYTLVRRCRQAGGAVTALVPATSSGGRGKPRLSAASEALVRKIIDEVYLTPQRASAAAVVREVRRRCAQARVGAPSASTIRRRVRTLTPADRRRRGERDPAAEPVVGASPAPRYPLDAVQMDHTRVDLILVDPIDREPIGRPWLTVAIDVFSRCIAGFHLSLEPPSATSVGLCLTHVAAEKAPWLEARGVEADWPIVGKPRRIGVDNGPEFHSEAFERGCAEHGIAIDWRPPGRPHFGGIVERVIGTLMELVHAPPGTTFSNPTERGSYDSDAKACLTLAELERWLAAAIAKYYHRRPHGGLDGEAPLSRHQAGRRAQIEADETPPVPRNPHAFLIDFLPVLRRSLQRHGIVVDHITYYSDALKPWIQARDRSGRLVVRRDPRDLSRIFVLDPEDGGYLEVPYRTLSRPSITLWEHKLALRRVRERRCAEVDEAALFAAIEDMRAIERRAHASTRTARRNRARRLNAAPPPERASSSEETPTASGAAEEGGLLRPFEDLEDW